jgi:hypothetical protein
MEERIMRTLGKIAATLGVIGTIAVGSAVPAAAWYGYYHPYYHHHYGYYPHRHYYVPVLPSSLLPSLLAPLAPLVLTHSFSALLSA